MQIALLYRSVPALTAVFRIQSIKGLRLGLLKPPGPFELPLYGVTTAIRGASTIAEGPSTDLGAGLPEIIETSNVPVYLYARRSELEEKAVKQLIALAESPLPVGYVSAMPDAHVGKGVSIGTVFASERYIAPMAVGVDIGCGMCAVPFRDLHKDKLRLRDLQKIQRLIKERIPTGRDAHTTPLMGAEHVLEGISHRHAPSQFVLGALKESRAAKQLGTLGGGNHFLELVYDETGRVWIMLHSGSRNIGNKTAQHYDDVAAKQLKRQGITVSQRLHYMEVDSEEGQSYLQDMEWCQDYAMANRRHMLDLMIGIVEEVAKSSPDMEQAVNIHHNFCQCERCTYTDPRSGEVIEKELYVTRKGATPAAEGQMGLIPGSMGAGSFVTRGRGNAGSWSSCSHGAGRRMSRTKAKERISQEDFAQAMRGVVCDTDARVRDEAPQAYKDLAKVMANQASLTDIVHRLRPLVNVKGF